MAITAKENRCMGRVVLGLSFSEFPVAKHRGLPLFVGVVVLLASGEAVSRAADDGATWLTDVPFRRRLTQQESVLWANSPLRASLLKFAEVQRVALLLDRRVDPDQELDLAVQDVPVLGIIREAGLSRNLDVSVLGNVVYLGPAASAGRLRTVAELRREEIAKLGSAVDRKFVEKAPLAWEDFASPREVLRRLAADSGLEMVNVEKVPHDLWPAYQLPPMSLTDRLTLILHQFDMTFQVAVDGRRVAVGPLPDAVALVRDYPGGSAPEELVQQWRAATTGCEFRVVGDRVYVRGQLEEHEAIEALRSPKRHAIASEARKPGPPGTKVFTADVPNRPLGKVLEHFARQLGLELQIDRGSLQEAGISLDQLVTFRVEEATLDELLQAVLDPVGCSYRRQGKILRVKAKASP